MKLSLHIFLFLCSPFVFSQNFTISGTLINESDEPIAYANILLFKSTVEDLNISSGFDKPIGTTTDENGYFEFEDMGKWGYALEASFIGYERTRKQFQLFSDVELSLILKEKTENLGEVVVTSKRPTLKKEVDRLIFNVANTALSEGTILDVLQSTPGVLILDNEISIKNTAPAVYINDRKVNLSSGELTQLLESSSANTIQKVEVITNPPAKYDAESGAVLNIVMLKNLITGYRGNVFANYTQGVFPRYNAGINQFYKTKKINVNVNYGFTKNKIDRNSEDQINYMDDNGVYERWNTKLDRNTWSKTHNLNFNFDYLIDDKNTLSLSSNLLFLPYFKYLTRGKSVVFDEMNDLDYHFDSHNLSRDKKHNLGFDFDFVHRFNDKSKLSFNSHVTKYDYNRNQDVNSNYFDEDDVFDFSTAFNTKNNQDTTIFTSQLDYELPMGESASFNAGAKLSRIEVVSDIIQFDVDTNTNEQTLNTENTNNYHYDESIFAGYVSFAKRWEKWNASGGIRIEQTSIEGKSITTNERNTQDYVELFPTLNLSYRLSEKTDVYVNYKRSIGRPSYKKLNPFNFFLNDNTIVSGNPTLQPAFTSHVTIGTSISKFTFEVYHKGGKSNILELPLQDNEENVIVSSHVNLKKTREIGVDFITSFDMLKNWSVYFLTSFYNIQDESTIDEIQLKRNLWSNYTTLNNSLSFLKDKSLSANLSLIYNGKNQYGFRITKRRLVSRLSIKKKVFKTKGIFSLAISDLFDAQDYEITSQYANQDNFNLTDLDTRYIRLGFNYKFGNTNLKTNERIKSTNERDRLNN